MILLLLEYAAPEAGQKKLWRFSRFCPFTTHFDVVYTGFFENGTRTPF
jgi:hypothetical protein